MHKFRIAICFVLLLSGCKETYCPMVSLSHYDSILLCENCQSPNLHKVSDDKCLITYIKSAKNGQDTLVMHSLENGILSNSQSIAHGSNWFVNWADIPSVVTMDAEGENLMAHWLQMSAEGTYDYDVRCSISKDSGKTWGESFVLHDDNVSAEHGFVTMVSDKDGAFVTWLDGRNTKTPISKVSDQKDVDKNHGHGHDHMPMTLRAAWIDKDGNKTRDVEIDDRVCDCCQTDAAITASGPVVVYRDRSEDEIRDISIARMENGKWTHKPLHNDNWKIAGCPVNGPAIAYKNGILAVAWYTQMNDLPKVFLSISKDDGNSFETPILISENEVLGRVDVAISYDEIIVTWMENDDEKTFISSKIIINGTPMAQETHRLLTTNASRSTGFPIIEYLENNLVLVRTVVEDENTSVFLELFDGP